MGDQRQTRGEDLGLAIPITMAHPLSLLHLGGCVSEESSSSPAFCSAGMTFECRCTRTRPLEQGAKDRGLEVFPSVVSIGFEVVDMDGCYGRSVRLRKSAFVVYRTDVV
jgi:hypothetical protein